MSSDNEEYENLINHDIVEDNHNYESLKANTPYEEAAVTSKYKASRHKTVWYVAPSVEGEKGDLMIPTATRDNTTGTRGSTSDEGYEIVEVGRKRGTQTVSVNDICVDKITSATKCDVKGDCACSRSVINLTYVTNTDVSNDVVIRETAKGVNVRQGRGKSSYTKSRIIKDCDTHTVEELLESDNNVDGTEERLPCDKSSDDADTSKYCCTGLVHLETGFVVVSTFDGQILVYDDECNFLYLSEFDENFQNMTSLTTKQVAITCGYRVNVYGISNKCAIECTEKSITFEDENISVHGIAVCKDKFVLTCNLSSVLNYSKPFIRITDMRGKKSKDIKQLKKGRVQHFKFPHCVAALTDGDAELIFVSDSDLESVMCLTFSGEILWEVAVAGTPREIILVHSKLILVNEKEKTIMVFSKTGKPIDFLHVDDDTKRPPALLCYNSSNKNLIFCNTEENGVKFPRRLMVSLKQHRQDIPCNML